jgi:hypothetical protein
MSSSKNRQVSVEKVEILVEQFFNIIEGTLNTVDQIAEVNTYKIEGKKVINASRFRMNLRKLKVQLMKDLKDPKPIQPPEPTDAA